MLLSLYASLRWWGKRHYALKMGIFAVLISVLSTVLAATWLSFVYGPASALSFPFYGYSDEVSLPQFAGKSGYPWIGYYQIRFLTGEIYQVFPIGYRVFQVTFLSIELGRSSYYNLSGHFYGTIIPFLFFMSVNLAGALIGILVNKASIGDKWKLEKPSLFGGLALGLIILGTGMWLGFLQVVRTVNSHSRIEHPYYIDAIVFVTFGIAWLIIMAGEIFAYFNR